MFAMAEPHSEQRVITLGKMSVLSPGQARSNASEILATEAEVQAPPLLD